MQWYASSTIDEKHSTIIGMRRCAIVIPALNEASTVSHVIQRAARADNCDVILVDDGSDDGTTQLAMNAGATVLPLADRLGAWGATQAGIRYAVANNYWVVVTMDADGQHQASEIPALIHPVMTEAANFTIGTYPQRASQSRQLAWWILKKLSGLQHADITSGFRAYDQKAATLLASAPASMLDYQDVGVLVLLKSADLIGAEVSVKMRSRASGKSKVFESWVKVFIYMAYSTVLSLSKRGSAHRPIHARRTEARHTP